MEKNNVIYGGTYITWVLPAWRLEPDLPFSQVAYRRCRDSLRLVAVLTPAKVPKHVPVQFGRKHTSPFTRPLDLLALSSSSGMSF
jgi:hypothetical protein